jgi:hypothetical protein
MTAALKLCIIAIVYAATVYNESAQQISDI